MRPCGANLHCWCIFTSPSSSTTHCSLCRRWPPDDGYYLSFSYARPQTQAGTLSILLLWVQIKLKVARWLAVLWCRSDEESCAGRGGFSCLRYFTASACIRVCLGWAQRALLPVCAYAVMARNDVIRVSPSSQCCFHFLAPETHHRSEVRGFAERD